jgi:hypothetical protein
MNDLSTRKNAKMHSTNFSLMAGYSKGTPKYPQIRPKNSSANPLAIHRLQVYILLTETKLGTTDMSIAAKKITPISPVDRLGALRAQIAEMEIIGKALVAEIKGFGPGVHDGALFSATVTEIDGRATFDRAKAEKRLLQLGASQDWVDNCVKIGAPSISLKLNDR